MEPHENSNQRLVTKYPALKARKRYVAETTNKRNPDLDVGHEINGGDEEGYPTPLRSDPANLEGQSQHLVAAADTDVGKCGVGRERESRYRYGRKARSLDGRCGDCTRRRGRYRDNVVRFAATASAAKTTLVCPVRFQYKDTLVR